MGEHYDELLIDYIENVSGGEYFRPCTGDDGGHSFDVVEIKRTGSERHLEDS